MSTAEPQTKPPEGDVELQNRMRLRRERRIWIAGIIASLVIGWALATLTMRHPSQKAATEPNENCPGVFLPNGTPLQTPSGNVKPKPGARGMSFTGVGTSVPTQPSATIAPSQPGAYGTTGAQGGYGTTGPSNAPTGTGAGAATVGTYGVGTAPVFQAGQTPTGGSAGNGIESGGSLTPGSNGVGAGGSLTGGGNGVGAAGGFAGGTTGVGGLGTGASGANTGIGGFGGFGPSGAGGR
jgi:hypothetical protein